MELSAWPGTIKTPAFTLPPLTEIVTKSPVVVPRVSAVAGETIAALSQVMRVTGLGNSCSQPLLDHSPSPTAGSGRKTTSSAPYAPAGEECARLTKSACGATLIAGSTVLATTPSCNEVSQSASKALSFSGRCDCQ